MTQLMLIILEEITYDLRIRVKKTREEEELSPRSSEKCGPGLSSLRAICCSLSPTEEGVSPCAACAYHGILWLVSNSRLSQRSLQNYGISVANHWLSVNGT